MLVKSFKSKFKGLGLPLHGVRLPAFSIDKASKRALKVSEDINNYNFLKSLCEKGLADLNKSKDKKYQKRLDYELRTLQDLSFVELFMIIIEMVNRIGILWYQQSKIR